MNKTIEFEINKLKEQKEQLEKKNYYVVQIEQAVALISQIAAVGILATVLALAVLGTCIRYGLTNLTKYFDYWLIFGVGAVITLVVGYTIWKLLHKTQYHLKIKALVYRMGDLQQLDKKVSKI